MLTMIGMHGTKAHGTQDVSGCNRQAVHVVRVLVEKK